MAQFTIYRSTDASAPVLTGQTGTLITLLDACLVNGYGSKSAAGWTKAFSGTSKAAYRQASGSNQFYLRIQDDGPGAGTFKEARMVGYETMSAVDTGTGPFPTVAQFANGMFVRKSTTLDATARPWILVADDRTLYFFVLTGDTSNFYMGVGFGDIYSVGGSSDGYRTMIIGNTTENNASQSNFGGNSSQLQSGSQGHYIARGHTGLGTAVNISKFGDYGKTGGSGSMLGNMPINTNPVDGGFYLTAMRIGDPTTATAPTLRGRFRGLWCGQHLTAGVSDGDTFTGTGDLAGKTFLIIKSVFNTSFASYSVIETSNTLLTN